VEDGLGPLKVESHGAHNGDVADEWGPSTTLSRPDQTEQSNGTRGHKPGSGGSFRRLSVDPSRWIHLANSLSLLFRAPIVAIYVPNAGFAPWATTCADNFAPARDAGAQAELSALVSGTDWTALPVLGEVRIVSDARQEPDLRGCPLVAGPPGIRYFAGAPIDVGDGRVGTIAVMGLVEGEGASDPAMAPVLEDFANIIRTELTADEHRRKCRKSAEEEAARAQQVATEDVADRLARILGVLWGPVALVDLTDEGNWRILHSNQGWKELGGLARSALGTGTAAQPSVAEFGGEMAPGEELGSMPAASRPSGAKTGHAREWLGGRRSLEAKSPPSWGDRDPDRLTEQRSSLQYPRIGSTPRGAGLAGQASALPPVRLPGNSLLRASKSRLGQRGPREWGPSQSLWDALEPVDATPEEVMRRLAAAVAGSEPFVVSARVRAAAGCRAGGRLSQDGSPRPTWSSSMPRQDTGLAGLAAQGSSPARSLGRSGNKAGRAATCHFKPAQPSAGGEGAEASLSGLSARRLYFVSLEGAFGARGELHSSVDQELYTPRQSSRASPFPDVQLGRAIRRRGAVTVRLAVWSGARVVVKVLRHSADVDRGLFDAVVSVQLSHPNLVRAYKWHSRPCADGSGLWETWVVKEHCNRGSLRDRCDQGKTRGEGGAPDAPQILAALREISGGVAHLHSRGLYHGRLTAENVLLVDSALRKGYTCKVADYWVDAVMGRGGAPRGGSVTTEGTRASRAEDPGWGDDGGLDTVLTPPEGLPALLSGDGSAARHRAQADVWSLGVLLWQMWTGQPPRDEAGAPRMLDAGGRVVVPAGMPAPVADLLREGLLNPDPGLRLSMAEAHARAATLLKDAEKGLGERQGARRMSQKPERRGSLESLSSAMSASEREGALGQGPPPVPVPDSVLPSLCPP